MNRKISYKIKTVFVLSLIIILNANAFSQSLTSNPYSYFGLGLIENNGLAETSATGSAGIAMPSSGNLNSTNPASYIGLDSSSFILSMGLYGKFSEFETKNKNQTDFQANIKYIAIGVKIARYWGAGFGLVPYSTRGYYISATYPAEGDLGEYQLISSGSGGINRFYFSNSFRITKHLTLGANISYLFGSLKNVEEMYYTDESFNNINISTTNYFRNWFFDFGLQYIFKVGKIDFYAGLTYNPLQTLNTSYQKLALNGTDTLAYDSKGNEDFTIPASVGIGLGANLFDKQLKIMADYKTMQWSKSDYHYKLAKLNDSWQINTGAEFVRDNMNSRNYWDYVNYRVGFRYEESYLSIKSFRINEKAFTFGLGFPTNYDKTRINVSYEYGVLGTKTNGLIREKYHRIILGIVLSDKWFHRYKYN